MRGFHQFLLSIFLIGWLLFYINHATALETSTSMPQVTKTDTSSARQCASATPEALLNRSFDFKDPVASDFPIEFGLQTFRPEEYAAQKTGNSHIVPFSSQLRRAPEGGPIVLKIFRPNIIPVKDWLDSYLNGIALTDEKDDIGKSVQVVRIGMSIREKTEEYIVSDSFVPDNPSEFLNELWIIVPILCGGSQNKVIGFASTRITSVSVIRAWAYSTIFIVVFWLLVSIATWQINRRKLQRLWSSEKNLWRLSDPDSVVRRRVWKGLKACDPVFIAQDSLGYGSLARFQILIFTTVVGFVLLYVLMHSGVASSLSYTILSLLGVTVVGGTVARFAGDWAGISPKSRRWLLASEIISTQQDKPRWSDLLETQGEIDVAKVQALLFTAVISISIFASGYIGLSSFTLPDQIVYLSIVSQGTYVFGKFLPADTRKKVEEDLSVLRQSAENLRSNDIDPQFQKEYKQAIDSARLTLDQTYGDKFQIDKFELATKDAKLVI